MKKTMLVCCLIAVLAVAALAAPQTASKTFTLVVTSQLTVSTTTLPGLVVGQAYSVTLLAIGGTGPYTWAIDSTTPLPTGLALNATSGVISGTVTSLPSACTAGSPCNISVKVNVTDSTP